MIVASLEEVGTHSSTEAAKSKRRFQVIESEGLFEKPQCFFVRSG
jgi:hypothetical protein